MVEYHAEDRVKWERYSSCFYLCLCLSGLQILCLSYVEYLEQVTSIRASHHNGNTDK